MKPPFLCLNPYDNQFNTSKSFWKKIAKPIFVIITNTCEKVKNQVEHWDSDYPSHPRRTGTWVTTFQQPGGLLYSYLGKENLYSMSKQWEWQVSIHRVEFVRVRLFVLCVGSCLIDLLCVG